MSIAGDHEAPADGSGDQMKNCFTLDGLLEDTDCAEKNQTERSDTEPSTMHVEMTSNKWHGIKQTLEVIRNSYRNCIITADTSKFHIMAYDNAQQSPGFLLEVPISNLEPYTCASPISVLVSTMQISNMLRHVRKRETVMFFIDSQGQRCGVLSNNTTGHARKSEISVSIVQLVYFEEPKCFAGVRPFVVSTADFGRMLKEMRNVAKRVVITSRPGEWIRFSVSALHLRSNDEWFGRINPLPPTLKREYSVLPFVRIIKISSLNTTDIELSFAQHDDSAALCVRVELPMLGRLSVFFSNNETPVSGATTNPRSDGETHPRPKRQRS